MFMFVTAAAMVYSHYSIHKKVQCAWPSPSQKTWQPSSCFKTNIMKWNNAYILILGYPFPSLYNHFQVPGNLWTFWSIQCQYLCITFSLLLRWGAGRMMSCMLQSNFSSNSSSSWCGLGLGNSQAIWKAECCYQWTISLHFFALWHGALSCKERSPPCTS